MFSEIQQELNGKPFLTNTQKIIPRLAEFLTASVRASITKEKQAIAFSGGVDSTLLAHLYKQHSKNYMLYAVGLPKSKDLEQAALVAAKMGFPLKLRIIKHNEAFDILTDVATAFKQADISRNPMDVAIASVIYAVLLMAQKDGIKNVLYGMGADSLFAGFDHHTNYKKEFSQETIQKNLWESLHHVEDIEIPRDQCIAQFANMRLIAPFLNKDLVTYAMHIDPLLKVNEQEKKIILRQTAVHLGIPKEIASNKKTAAQYGTGFTEFIKEQTKEQGYERSEEFLNGLI